MMSIPNLFNWYEYRKYLQTNVIQYVIELEETIIRRYGIIKHRKLGFEEKVKPKIIFVNFTDPDIKVWLGLKNRRYDFALPDPTIPDKTA